MRCRRFCARGADEFAATGARPLTLAITAQIERHRMFDGQPSGNHRCDKVVPAPSLIPDPVNENVSFLFRITPLPIMKF